MRAVIQRVKSASVHVDDKVVSSIGQGILLFLGIISDDTAKEMSYIIKKSIDLRIFEDDEGKMNLSVADIAGEVLVVSQFTLYGDCRKGRRPSFSKAAPPKEAENIYNEFKKEISARYDKVKFGTFQAMMDVHLVNDGPVTMLLDSSREF
ncbi:D-aminoacyl-tRNA deacylase [Thermodesulfobacteriota bacterium]